MIAADQLHEDGVKRLASAVLEKAVSDYRALKASNKKYLRKASQRFVRTAEMEALESFFSPDGGAKYYLELMNSSITPDAILKELTSTDDSSRPDPSLC